MALIDDLINDVLSVLSNNWNIRDGQVVPFSDQVRLAGGAVRLEATMLYADLADSTELAMRFDRRVAAKVFKSFLTCSSRIIRARGGEIRSFDGDRVMGIFLGPLKNTSAAKCALNINYAFAEIIKPRLDAKYSQLQTDYRLAHCVGIDTSEVLAVRGGVVNNNDLVWVGRAPNVAAKLSGLREHPYHSFITAAVYNKVQENVKFSSDGSYMWEQRTWDAVDGVSRVYRSSWWWKP
jgi:class 3 adenylate cyclase